MKLLPVLLVLGMTSCGRVDGGRDMSAAIQISCLNTALESLKADCGRFPTTEQGLAMLWTRPAGLGETNWRGPYLDSPAPLDPVTQALGPAWANVSLSLRLHLGEACSYTLLDILGNVTETGLLSSGSTTFNLGGGVNLTEVGEREQNGYFHMELAAVPEPSSYGIITGALLLLPFGLRGFRNHR